MHWKGLGLLVNSLKPPSNHRQHGQAQSDWEATSGIGDLDWQTLKSRKKKNNKTKLGGKLCLPFYIISI